ncbi:MAG TPA: hypothetical protein VFG45_09860 [Candidatus Nitrosocosmicus sp.]|nr:hypothetical protein [Candidatus Nitrosocosmicus sp.]
MNSLTLLALIAIISVTNTLPFLERAWADEVLATINVGQSPTSLGFNPSNNQVYVVNRGSDTVSVIDSDSNTVIKNISVGDFPEFEPIFNPSNTYMYLANGHSDTVSVIDSDSNTVIKNISVGHVPQDLLFNPSNNNIYVANSYSDTVSVIDTERNEVIDTIEVGTYPFQMAYSLNNNNVYVANIEPGNPGDIGTITVIDGETNEVIDTIEVGTKPYDLIFNPRNNYIYSANWVSDTVSVIDTSTNEVIRTIEVGDGPISLEFAPSTNNVYVANQVSDTVSVIDTERNEVIDTIEVGNSPVDLEYNPANNRIYVGNEGYPGDITIIEVTFNEAVGTTNVGGIPISLLFNPYNNNIYVANFESGNVNVVGIIPPPTIEPTADAGPDQSVKSNDIVQLNGSNSSDHNGSSLSYLWTQVSGQPVELSDSTTSNPTFTAPEVNDYTDLTFQLIVTNAEGIVSEPDEVIITINPISQPPPNEEPRTIGDLLKGIIKNPLDVANSIDSANQIKDILTDGNRNNDQLVCNLIDEENEQMSNIRQILNC